MDDDILDRFDLYDEYPTCPECGERMQTDSDGDGVMTMSYEFCENCGTKDYGEPVRLTEQLFDFARTHGLMENPAMNEERMLKWFACQHLPANLQAVSAPFGQLAEKIVADIPPGPERTVALRKLLESKDAAVRAAINPGG